MVNSCDQAPYRPIDPETGIQYRVDGQNRLIPDSGAPMGRNLQEGFDDSRGLEEPEDASIPTFNGEPIPEGYAVVTSPFTGEKVLQKQIDDWWVDT